jgi:toluene monooxygenase system protein D
VIDAVGPVLEVGEAAEAVIAAIRELNDQVTVQDRGAYLRVLVPRRCIVRRDAIERALGRPFALPGDLERLMPSFRGRMTIDDELAEWSWSTSSR